MSKQKKTIYNSGKKTIMDYPIIILIVAILGILLGLFFIVSTNSSKPISLEEANAYAGNFDYYDTTWENYRDIYFEDGSRYYVYPHTESSEFREKMESLKKGTKLYILVNPNNDYVMEVKTETEELLNFETSQLEIYTYEKGYAWIGIFCCVGGVLLVLYAIALTRNRKEEAARDIVRKENGGNISLLRYADKTVKSRILLETRVEGYQICYRRVKTKNELVINGRVYDEKKGIIEFAHKLCATINGHDIEVGYDNESYSYIMFDGEIIKRKKRWI